MTVTDLATHRFPPQHLPVIDRAEALVAVARGWEQIVELFSTGPDSLSEDDAEECTQHLVSSLVHPNAVPVLVMQMPQLRSLVKRRDDLRDGMADPHDEDCHTIDEAVTEMDARIDLVLYPLVHGRPVGDACRQCMRRCASVNAWQPRVSCTWHAR
jgi:hypothetical protein